MEPLCMGLILLGAMQTQAQGSKQLRGLPTPLTPNLSFHKICLQPHLEGKGQWFILGLTGKAFKRGDSARLRARMTTSKLRDGQLLLTSDPPRALPCDAARTPIPKDQPGWAHLRGWEELGSKNDQMDVVETDYKRFALVIYRESRDPEKGWATILLLGRKKELEFDLKEKLITFTGTLDVPRGHIIFLPKAVDCDQRPE